MTEIRFDNLGPADYDRCKVILNKARHPGFVGRELFFRCATTGVCCVAVVDDADLGVALVAKDKLQALSVVREAQGRGVGGALMTRLQPRWVNAIGEKIAWFEKLGYKCVGAPKVGQNGKHSTQLLERDSTAASAVAEHGVVHAPTAPIPAREREAEEPAPARLSQLIGASNVDRWQAQIELLDELLAKATIDGKYDSVIKITERAEKLLGLIARAPKARAES